MRRFALFSAIFASLALPAQAQMVCTINNSLGCFAGGGGVTASADYTWTGLHTFDASPTAASFFSGQLLVERETAPGACTGALSGAGAGNVDDGAHYYKVTFVDSVGETEAGIASAVVTVADKTVDGQVSLTNIPTGTSGIVTSRKVYRTEAGLTTYRLLTTIADNSTSIYTDNTADAGLGATAPTANTTRVRLAYEGTADAHEGRLLWTDPTADRVVAFPDASLTVAGYDLAQTWSAIQTFGLSAATTNAVVPVTFFQYVSSATALAGVGLGIDFFLEDSSSETVPTQAGSIDITYTNVTTATRDSDMKFNVWDNGSEVNAAYFDGSDLGRFISVGGMSSPGKAGTSDEVFGAGAGAALVAGADNNSLFGNGAGAALNNAASDNNACFGTSACASVTSGSTITALGSGAASTSIATGTADVFIGYQAGLGIISNATGDVIIGSSAGTSIDNHYNVCVGRASCADVDLSNACVGDTCLGGDATNTMDYNSGLGSGAGNSLSDDSDSNICLGYESCSVAAAGSLVRDNTTTIMNSVDPKNDNSILIGFGAQEAIFVQGTPKALTESTATAIVRISVASGSYTGASIRWRVVATDGADYQTLSGETVIDCVNKAAAENCVIRTIPLFAAAVEIASAGTLALDADPTWVSSVDGTVDVLLDATSSLAQTTLAAYYSVEINGPATTITPQ